MAGFERPRVSIILFPVDSDIRATVVVPFRLVCAPVAIRMVMLVYTIEVARFIMNNISRNTCYLKLCAMIFNMIRHVCVGCRVLRIHDVDRLCLSGCCIAYT